MRKAAPRPPDPTAPLPRLSPLFTSRQCSLPGSFSSSFSYSAPLPPSPPLRMPLSPLPSVTFLFQLPSFISTVFQPPYPTHSYASSFSFSHTAKLRPSPASLFLYFYLISSSLVFYHFFLSHVLPCFFFHLFLPSFHSRPLPLLSCILSLSFFFLFVFLLFVPTAFSLLFIPALSPFSPAVYPICLFPVFSAVFRLFVPTSLLPPFPLFLTLPSYRLCPFPPLHV